MGLYQLNEWPQGHQFKVSKLYMVRTRSILQYFPMGAYLCPEPTSDTIRPLVSDKTTRSETNSRRTNQNLPGSRVQSYSLDPQEKKCGIEDFVIKGELGQGGFASVYIVELKRNAKRGLKKEFAMKKIGKKKLKDRKVIENLKVQRMVYTSIKSNFIISLNYAFQDKAFCYFVMEFAEGGDVYSLINNSKQPIKSRMYRLLRQEGARFILACVILGMECAHHHNIIYRDLKPENVLIFKNGYIKLTDFGLAKQIKTDQISNTVAGTKIYYAPQLLEKKGHNKAVDFWTLGVFLHQLILYCPPFDGYSIVPGRFTNLCLKAEQNRDWKGSNISPQAKNLINSFLKVKPDQRLGMNGFQQIKNHPFFSKFDWETLSEMRMQSPLVEIVKQFPMKPKVGFGNKSQQVPRDCGYQIEGLTYNPDTLRQRNSNLN